MIKNIISSYIEYLDANNLYVWVMSQKLPIDGFKWVKKLFEFDDCFILKNDENSDKGYFFDVDVFVSKRSF